jgi:hemerythrin superfamily protein
MAADAVTLIMNDHRLLDGLLAQLSADQGDRQVLVEEITARLTAHARAEEQEVYPAITQADPDQEPEVDHAYDEHWQAEHELAKVRNLIASPHFGDAVTAFVAAVKHHVEEEENEVLPRLRKVVDAGTLQRLGAAFAQARARELAQTGFATPDDAADPDSHAKTETVVDDGAAELDTASRDELYDMAKKADIAGRSGMNKNELAEALRKQG